MDEEQLDALGGRPLEQLGMRRDTGGDGVHGARAGDLEPVVAVILEAVRGEQAVELLQDLLYGR